MKKIKHRFFNIVESNWKSLLLIYDYINIKVLEDTVVDCAEYQDGKSILNNTNLIKKFKLKLEKDHKSEGARVSDKQDDFFEVVWNKVDGITTYVDLNSENITNFEITIKLSAWNDDTSDPTRRGLRGEKSSWINLLPESKRAEQNEIDKAKTMQYAIDNAKAKSRRLSSRLSMFFGKKAK